MQGDDGLPVVLWLGILVGLTKVVDFIIATIGKFLGYVSTRERAGQNLVIELEERMTSEHGMLSKKVDVLEARIADNYREMVERDERLASILAEQMSGHETRMRHHIDKVAEGISSRISDLISIVRRPN